MTTNQTIDGVPRDLLQKIADGGYCHQGLMDRLRAILDKEVGGDSRAPLLQGEPVAWIKEHWSGKHADFHYKSLDDVVFKEDWKPLYAEQLAPVAVTLNQVLAAYDYAEAHPHKYLRGTTNWCAAVAHKLNACLDELKRLNPSL